jgi:Uma2 family endonuclease
MVELKLGLRTVDLPYTLRLYGVTEEKFDELVTEDMKAELLDGVMIVHSPASPRHDVIANFLRGLICNYADAKELGKGFGPDAMIHLATCRRFAPDAFFIEQARVPVPLPRDQFEILPDLIVEVLSPSNRDDDLHDKRPAYRQAGVKELWFVDFQREEIIIDQRRGKRYISRTIRTGRVESTALSGFWIEADWLWNDPLPNQYLTLQTILST